MLSMTCSIFVIVAPNTVYRIVEVTKVPSGLLHDEQIQKGVGPMFVWKNVSSSNDMPVGSVGGGSAARPWAIVRGLMCDDRAREGLALGIGQEMLMQVIVLVMLFLVVLILLLIRIVRTKRRNITHEPIWVSILLL